MLKLVRNRTIVQYYTATHYQVFETGSKKSPPNCQTVTWLGWGEWGTSPERWVWGRGHQNPPQESFRYSSPAPSSASGEQVEWCSLSAGELSRYNSVPSNISVERGSEWGPRDGSQGAHSWGYYAGLSFSTAATHLEGSVGYSSISSSCVPCAEIWGSEIFPFSPLAMDDLLPPSCTLGAAWAHYTSVAKALFPLHSKFHHVQNTEVRPQKSLDHLKVRKKPNKMYQSITSFLYLPSGFWCFRPCLAHVFKSSLQPWELEVSSL